MLLCISVGVALVMAIALFRLFFKDFADFVECLRFYFQPNLISLFRGEMQEDFWGSTKLGVWLALSVAMGFAALYKLPQLFPSLAPTAAARESEVWLAEDVEAEEVVRTDWETSKADQMVAGATNSGAATAALNTSSHAARYGVKLGDTVEIAALRPAIALRRATIAALNEDQLTVRSGYDSYTVLWKDVTKLKPNQKK